MSQFIGFNNIQGSGVFPYISTNSQQFSTFSPVWASCMNFRLQMHFIKIISSDVLLFMFVQKYISFRYQNFCVFSKLNETDNCICHFRYFKFESISICMVSYLFTSSVSLTHGIYANGQHLVL